MKGMAARYLGRRPGRVDFRTARALVRAARKVREIGASLVYERKSLPRYGDGKEPRPGAVRVKSDSEKELLEELRKSLTWMKALEGRKADRTPKQASTVGSEIKEPRRIPIKRDRSAAFRRRAVAVLALSLLIAAAAGWVLFQKAPFQKRPFATSQPRWKAEPAM